jgi:hypothetical protein
LRRLSGSENVRSTRVTVQPSKARPGVLTSVGTISRLCRHAEVKLDCQGWSHVEMSSQLHAQNKTDKGRFMRERFSTRSARELLTAQRPTVKRHSCEIYNEEIQAAACGKPASFQSPFTWHLKERRYLWVCDEHREALRRLWRSGANYLRNFLYAKG